MPITETATPTTYWVCQDCYFATEGDVDDESTPDREPMNLISDTATVTVGLIADAHDDECPVWLGDPNHPDVPVREAECECERQTFSWRRCDGCGSRLGGSREALTVWEDNN